MELHAPAGIAFPFEARITSPESNGRLTLVGPDGIERSYPLGARSHPDYLDLFAAAAEDFGTRTPLGRLPAETDASPSPLQPVVLDSPWPEVLYGFGDPAVTRVENGAGGAEYFLLVTSNDAPDAFPILRSPDFVDWSLAGFVFPRGHKPAWAADGPDVSDFWAPELHQVGDEFWVCYSARDRDGELAIGIARSDSPVGPFASPETPLLRGGVIDAHIALGPDGAPYLFWKEDTNGEWPRLLPELLHGRPELIEVLFDREEDRRTASLITTLRPWVSSVPRMEQFYLLQPLIEAVTADLPRFEERMLDLRSGTDPEVSALAAAIVEALKTRIFAQRLSTDGDALEGERSVVLQNDLPWEAHLIEGVWVAEHDGRYWLFYAGNDFSTPAYGLGAAVADHPLGPYVKIQEPLLRTGGAWVGPGHPSVAVDPEGAPRLFLHAFRPGEVGYKAFRAALSARIAFEQDRVRLY
jgi:hypothetical protein